jgi:small nuclear ribonucleoprotein
MLNDPFSFLKMFLKEKVTIKLKSGESYEGVLEGFDEHVNLMLTKCSLPDAEDKLAFFRGENILFIGHES